MNLLNKKTFHFYKIFFIKAVKLDMINYIVYNIHYIVVLVLIFGLGS